MHKQITMWLDPELLAGLDRLRGGTPRVTAIKQLIRGASAGLGVGGPAPAVKSTAIGGEWDRPVGETQGMVAPSP